MEKFKRVFSTKAALCLALSLLLVCAVAAVGITYARYQWEFAQASYYFTPENSTALTVYGAHLSDDLISSGNLPATSGAWEQTENGAQLNFSVSNGTPEEHWQQDQTFVIRLAAGLTADNPDHLSVVLSYTDEQGDPVTVAAEPASIASGSFQHSAFGDGWSYSFRDGEVQLRFSLSGDTFSYRNFTVTVTGTVPATLLELQVTQVPAA